MVTALPRRDLLLLWLLAALVRAIVAARTAIPDRDAAHYLWLAERVAAGEATAPLQSVFHPLLPWLIGLLLRIVPSLDPVAAGQWTSAGLSSLAVLPISALAGALYGRRAAWIAGAAFALGIGFARPPADALSEGPFQLSVGAWAWALARRPAPSAGAAATAGIAAALAYAARPEGAALLLCGALRTQGLAALAFLAGAAPAGLLPLGWAAFGPGATLTPKAAFTWGVGASGAADPVAHYAVELVQVPGALCEAAGWLVVPLAIAGILLARRTARRDALPVLLGPLVLQMLVVPLLFSHPRFFAGFGLLLLPFAGLAWSRIAPWLAARARWLPFAALALLFARDFVLLPAARREERRIERQLGAELRHRLGPGERIASDMPRLDYFAGVPPGPPRPIRAEELHAAAADPRVRFVAWVQGRTPVEPRTLAAIGLSPVELPPPVAAAAAARGIELFGR